MSIAGGVIELATDARVPRKIAGQIGELGKALAGVDAVVRIAAALQGSVDFVIEVSRENALDLRAEGGLNLVAFTVLLAGNAARGVDEDIRRDVNMRDPGEDRAIGTMKGEARNRACRATWDAL